MNYKSRKGSVTLIDLVSATIVIGIIGLVGTLGSKGIKALNKYNENPTYIRDNVVEGDGAELFILENDQRAYAQINGINTLDFLNTKLETYEAKAENHNGREFVSHINGMPIDDYLSQNNEN